MRRTAEGATLGPNRNERGSPMLRALFARLTGEPRRGHALFALAVQEASQPHWFVEGEVPDTVNGRFAVLATTLSMVVIFIPAPPGSSRMVCTDPLPKVVAPTTVARLWSCRAPATSSLALALYSLTGTTEGSSAKAPPLVALTSSTILCMCSSLIPKLQSGNIQRGLAIGV